jgi:hypothetical protein
MLRVVTCDITDSSEKKRIVDLANDVARKTQSIEMRAYRLKARLNEGEDIWQVIVGSPNDFYINLRYRKGSLIVFLGTVGREKNIQHILFKAAPETVSASSERKEETNKSNLAQIVKSDMSSEHRKLLLSLLQHDPSDSKIDFADNLVKTIRVSLARLLSSSGHSSWQCVVSLRSNSLQVEGVYDEGTFANIRVGKWRLIVWRANYVPAGIINYPSLDSLIYLVPLFSFGYFLYLNNTCTSYCDDKNTPSYCTLEQQIEEEACEESKQLFAQVAMYTVLAVGAFKFVRKRLWRATSKQRKRTLTKA